MSTNNSSAARLGLWAIFVAGCAAVSTGCASFSTMQTARVLEPGGIRGYSAPAVYAQELPISAGANQRYPAPLMEFGARYGLFPRVDIGARLWTFGCEFDAKVQIVRSPTDDRGFDFSIAPGLGSNNVFLADSVDYYLPLIAGFNLPNGHAILISPKVQGSLKDFDLGRALFVGSSLGVALKLSERHRILPEVTVMYPAGRAIRDPASPLFRGTLPILQLGVGFLFDR